MTTTEAIIIIACITSIVLIWIIATILANGRPERDLERDLEAHARIDRDLTARGIHLRTDADRRDDVRKRHPRTR